MCVKKERERERGEKEKKRGRNRKVGERGRKMVEIVLCIFRELQEKN